MNNDYINFFKTEPFIFVPVMSEKFKISEEKAFDVLEDHFKEGILKRIGDPFNSPQNSITYVYNGK